MHQKDEMFDTNNCSRQNHESKTRYHPLWDVMIPGLPQCPVWCRLYSTVYQRKWPGHPKLQNRTSDPESNGRLWIGKPRFLFEFPSNHMSISLSFEDIRMWQTDRWTDGRITWTITIAGPHIVAGQLIISYKNQPLLHSTAAWDSQHTTLQSSFTIVVPLLQAKRQPRAVKLLGMSN